MKKIPRQKIFEVLSALKGNVGLYVQSLDSGETFAVNAEQACSLALVSVCLLKGLLYAFALLVLVMKRERWLLLQGRSHGL